MAIPGMIDELRARCIKSLRVPEEIINDPNLDTFARTLTRYNKRLEEHYAPLIEIQRLLSFDDLTSVSVEQLAGRYDQAIKILEEFNKKYED